MRENFVILLLLIFVSCNNEDSFYTKYGEEDLVRVPLIKPYKLTSPLGGRASTVLPYPWLLKLMKVHRAQDGLYKTFLNVRVINIEDSIIYGGPGKYPRDSYPDYWFIVDTKTSKEMLFEDEITWRNKLEELGCRHDTIYDILPLFNSFRDQMILPWGMPKEQ